MSRHTPEPAAPLPAYLNPVDPAPCPDPYVLKHAGEYWCYSTGLTPDGRCFGVRRSRDLVHWQTLAGAMERLPPGALHVPDTCYWAPEAVYANGRFYLYYSAGNEAHMQIRVAVAQHPAGPFVDSGRRLTAEEFAIDAHVFVDDDGTRYLFYATDFLDHSRVGTGIVMDRLLDPFTLAGQPRPVTRAQFDWQVYDPQRKDKGGVRWHTVEGPFVLKRKGRYYEMFSGGNWQNVTYGVGYAVTDDLNAPGEWAQACDGERVRPVLHTLPEAGVIGPGHNSVVRGPDNLQLFCVYHRWAPDIRDRVLAIDRLEWAGDRMLVLGPSTTPQPAPARPAWQGFAESKSATGLGPDWACAGGAWAVRSGAAVQPQPRGNAEARRRLPASAFVLEVTLSASPPGAPGRYGIRLNSAGGPALQFSLARRAEVRAGNAAQPFDLGADFDPEADHLLRLEVNGRWACLALDGESLRWRGQLPAAPLSLTLFTQEQAAAFKGLELTVGWADDFCQPVSQPAALDWHAAEAGGDWRIAAGELRQEAVEAEHALVTKAALPGSLLGSYELVVNARLEQEARVDGRGLPGGYGFYPALGTDQPGPLLKVERREAGWALVSHAPEGRQVFALPDGFDPFRVQHFRFRKHGGRLSVHWASHLLGETAVPAGPGRIGLYTHRASAAFELVRAAALVR